MSYSIKRLTEKKRNTEKSAFLLKEHFYNQKNLLLFYICIMSYHTTNCNTIINIYLHIYITNSKNISIKQHKIIIRLRFYQKNLDYQ